MCRGRFLRAVASWTWCGCRRCVCVGAGRPGQGCGRGCDSPPWVTFGVPWCHRVPTPSPRAQLRARLGGVWPGRAPARLEPCPVGARSDEARSRRERPAGAGPFSPAGPGSRSRARRRSGSAPSAGGCCVSVGRGPLAPPLPPVASAAPRPRGVCVWVSRRGSTRSSPRTPPVPPAPPPAEVGLRPRRRLGARPAPVPGFSLARAGERVSERRSPPVPPS